MTYYRRPVRVDLSGYINAAGIQSTDIDPELPDRFSGGDSGHGR